jgi:hypothetical protein
LVWYACGSFAIRPKSVTLTFDRLVDEDSFGELAISDFWFKTSLSLAIHKIYVPMSHVTVRDSTSTSRIEHWHTNSTRL